MIELSTWAGLEPAVMDIKTVSGLAQVFELTFTDSSGGAVDLTGVSFRGAVNTAPLKEFVCSVKDGKVLFGWTGLPAGRHSFDLFMVTGSVEKALIHGAFVVAGRVLPPLDQESYTVNNAATAVFPDTVDGVLLVELSEVGLVDLLSRRAGAFAGEAKGYLKSIRELKEWIGGEVDGFGDVLATATTAITEAGAEAAKVVSAEKDGALTAVRGVEATAITAITEAGAEAAKVVSAEKDGALTAVRGVEATATTAITEAGAEAAKVVSAEKDGALTAVRGVEATATMAITEAGAEAVRTVSAEKEEAVVVLTECIERFGVRSGEVNTGEPGSPVVAEIVPGTHQGEYVINLTIPAGKDGEKGDPGLRGEKGDPGLRGEKGDPGLRGEKGDPGLRGEKGDPGLRGEKGDPGLRGEKGDPGLRGEKGDPGLRGEKGDPGLRGEKGDPGLRGEKGDPGAPGPRGFGVTPGCFAWFCGPPEKCPEGWLVCMGDWLDTTQYPELFAAIGDAYGGSGNSFMIPDLYSTGGRFIRSCATGVNVGTLQGDAMRNLTGSIMGQPLMTSANNPLNKTNGIFKITSSVAGQKYAVGGSQYAVGVFADASQMVPVADEFRPANIALVPLIKY